MNDDAAAARDLLMRAAVLREEDDPAARQEARDLVAAAHVHALLVTATVATGVGAMSSRSPVSGGPVGQLRPISELVVDPAVVAYGAVVNAEAVVELLRAKGRIASVTVVGNELGRHTKTGEYTRQRRGWYVRNRP